MSEAVTSPDSEVVGGGTALADTDIHHLLSNERRRLVLDRLRSGNGDMTLRELSEQIATHESGESPAPRNVRQSVYVSLHQTHLPKLDDHGVIVYDPESKRVQLRDRAEEVSVYLESVPKYGLSWSEFYLSVASLGLLTVAGATIGVPILETVPTVGWAVGHLLVVAGAALYQTVRQGRSILHRLLDR